MKLPRQIRVLGGLWKLRWDFPFTGQPGEADYGETVEDLREIRIATALNADEKARTLLHELCHAGLVEAGLSNLLDEKTEEAVITCIENTLTPHIRLVYRILTSKAAAGRKGRVLSDGDSGD